MKFQRPAATEPKLQVGVRSGDMKLYFTPASPYARMARVVVIEKALQGRVEMVIAKTRQVNSPYYRINPSGRVPYLALDDGTGMEEASDGPDAQVRLQGRRATGQLSGNPILRSNVSPRRTPVIARLPRDSNSGSA